MGRRKPGCAATELAAGAGRKAFETDKASGIGDNMHWQFQKVIEVKPLENYRLFVKFEDGLSGEVDLSGDLRGPVFEPLKDPAFFKQVAIDDHGAPCWPNQADLAPDALYEALSSTTS